MRLGELEIRLALGIAAQSCAIALISGKAGERDQSEGDVVGALMRHEIADQVAAAGRDDGEPLPRIILELRALERIDLVTNENGHGHQYLHSSMRTEHSRLPHIDASAMIEP